MEAGPSPGNRQRGGHEASRADTPHCPLRLLPHKGEQTPLTALYVCSLIKVSRHPSLPSTSAHSSRWADTPHCPLRLLPHKGELMKVSRHYALFSTLFPLYMWADTTHWYRCMYGHSWKEADPTHCFLRCFPNICEQTPLITRHVCTIITSTYEYIIYCSLCLLHHLHNTHRPRRLLPSFTSAGIYTLHSISVFEYIYGFGPLER